LELMNRPRYIYSEEPNSPWADFLRGLPINRCTCGLVWSGSVSSFHAPAWTAVTLEPPNGQAFPAEAFASLTEQILSGTTLVPPLLLFQSFGAIHRAMSQGAAESFVLIPLASLIYQDVSETSHALRVLIAKAVSLGLFSDAYLFIKNAAVLHPDLFWLLFDQARQFAEAAGSAADLDAIAQQLAPWRKAPSLDREAVFVCCSEHEAGGQIYYASSGHFDAQQNLQLSADEKVCTSLPPWLLPKPPLSVAHKCLLDLHIHAAGEFLFGQDPTGSHAITELLRQARERLAKRYPQLTETQQAEARELYATLGGRALL
jgi:hypothetical protein